MIITSVSAAESSLVILTSQCGDDRDTVIGAVGHPCLLTDIWVKVPALRSFSEVKTGSWMEGNVPRAIKAIGNLDDLGTIEFGDAHRKAQRRPCSPKSAAAVHTRREEDIVTLFLATGTAGPNLDGRRAGFSVRHF